MGFFVRGGKNGMGCYVWGDKNCMGCYVRGDKNSMGCFVRGGKSLWDVLSRVSKNGMGCFVPGCFVRLMDAYISTDISSEHIKQIFDFGVHEKKPNYFRGTKTLLGNRLGNLRKQIFDFRGTGEQASVLPCTQGPKSIPGSSSLTLSRGPVSICLSCWWDVKHRSSQALSSIRSH